MTDIALAGQQSAVPLPELAARHGLTVAGQRPTIPAYLKLVWEYRNFILAYANGRMTAQFNTARLGRIWQVLNPLTNASVYFLIFGVVLNTKHGIHNYIAYLCTGVFIFSFTQTVIQSGAQAISGNIALIRALHFPRASLPIAMTVMQVQNLIASVVVLVAIVILSGETPTAAWLMLIPALLLQALFSSGLALVVARLGAKVTDLKQVIPFVMRTWMYTSGVMYSVQLFADHLPATMAKVLLANPMLVYIELARHALIDGSVMASTLPQLWALAVGWALVSLVAGFLYFWRGEREYGRG